MENNKPWFVYILQCQDDSLYTGITVDLEKRMETHKSGKGSKYVKSKKFKKLLHAIRVDDKSEAAKLEYKIKQLNRNDKITFFTQHTEIVYSVSDNKKTSKEYTKNKILTLNIISKLYSENTCEIKNNIYEIFEIWTIYPVINGKEEEITEIDLRNIKSNKITPTHKLSIHTDSGEIELENQINKEIIQLKIEDLII